MKYIKYFENYSAIVIGDKIITRNDLNKILKGYITCALWTDEEELKTQNAQIDVDIENVDYNSLIASYNDIKKFIELAGSDNINYAIEANGLERLGHDIWLTRNGHGAGFFDHNYDEDVEKKLIESGKSLGSKHIYINDENKIDFE